MGCEKQRSVSLKIEPKSSDSGCAQRQGMASVFGCMMNGARKMNISVTDAKGFCIANREAVT